MHIQKLESDVGKDATIQWKMFDMEQAYASQKSILQGQIEEMEKDIAVSWSRIFFTFHV